MSISKKSKVTKVIAGLLGFSMVLSVVAGAVPAQAQSVADLTAQINSLLSTITALQAQLSAMQGGTASPIACATFSTDLTIGSTGEAVRSLQKVLNSSADTQVAASGVWSVGNESTTFGSLTKAAVVKCQEKYASEILSPAGLTVGTGIVGSSTRAKLNSLLGK